MTRTRWPGAALVDVLAVVVFVVIGRASHHHTDTASGVASTLWPFVVGVGAGWGILGILRALLGRRLPPSSLPAGATVCVATVAVGMALRVAAGQGTAPAFIGVTTGFLGAVMLGGRILLEAAGRRLGRAARG